MLERIKNVIGRLGRKTVTYDESFFVEAWFEEWLDLRIILRELIVSNGKWKKNLDFGCGPGAMIDFMNDSGFPYVGCDYSLEANELYKKNFGKYPQYYFRSLRDINEIDQLDLFLAFDVFEHMADDEIISLLSHVKNIPQLFLNISRARGIPGHVNLKKDKEWISFFRMQGYALDEAETMRVRSQYTRLRPGSPDKWHENMFVFTKDF